MQNENGNGEGSSGQQSDQAQVGEEPDHLRVEAGEGKVVRVEVDGKVVRGKLAVVTIVDDEGPQLVRWEELEAGCLYVDRFASGDVSGVLQVQADGKAWRWAWTPYSSTGGWGEMYWHEEDRLALALRAGDIDAPAAELVGRCASDEIAVARATFEAWALERGEVLRPPPCR